MDRAEIDYSVQRKLDNPNAHVKKLAESIIADQSGEVAEMHGDAQGVATRQSDGGMISSVVVGL